MTEKYVGHIAKWHYDMLERREDDRQNPWKAAVAADRFKSNAAENLLYDVNSAVRLLASGGDSGKRTSLMNMRDATYAGKQFKAEPSEDGKRMDIYEIEMSPDMAALKRITGNR